MELPICPDKAVEIADARQRTPAAKVLNTNGHAAAARISLGYWLGAAATGMSFWMVLLTH